VSEDRELRRVDDADVALGGRALAVEPMRFERCTFRGHAWGGRAAGLEVVDCVAWRCSLHDVHLEDCLVRNLKTSPPGGGRKMPLFLWGGTTRRVRIEGTVSGVIWNPPKVGASLADTTGIEALRVFYDEVDDWALDVSEARFRSTPSLRCGPPGRLIRRNPETQPLIGRRGAELALSRDTSALGVWRVVLRELLDGIWPDETALIPALGGPKARYQAELAGLARLREIGALEAE
jgi:hypothetical protein